MGLSFSSTYKNLKDVYKLKEKHNKGKVLDIYWILEKSDIPEGLSFEPDRDKKGHYFLTATKPMTLIQLIDKLKFIARKMSVIRSGGKVL